jgi:hypothetical protein
LIRSLHNLCNSQGNLTLEAELESDLWELEEEIGAFDLMWMNYERDYIGELMVIETDARRFITESIRVE